MHLLLAALLYFGILTLWVPEYWPVTVFQVGMFALASCALWRARHRLSTVYPLFPLGFAAVWGLFQLAAGWTPYAFVTQKATVYWATLLAAYLAGLSLFTEERVRRWFRAAMLWFGFSVAVLATLQTFTSDGRIFWIFPSPYTRFVMGPILSQNHYAAFVETTLPIALYEALRPNASSFLYSGAAAAMYASVIASASRAGAVLATAEIVVVVALVCLRGRASGRAIGGSLAKIGLLLVVFTAVVGYQTIWKRFEASDPMAQRREFAIASAHMIAAHPWSGVGLGAWPVVYPHFAFIDVGASVDQAHNDWLQWAAEGGIPFGLLMVTMFLWCLRPSFRSVWGVGVVAVFLHATVDYPFSRPALASWTIVLVAMLAAQRSAGGQRPRSSRLPPSAADKSQTP